MWCTFCGREISMQLKLMLPHYGGVILGAFCLTLHSNVSYKCRESRWNGGDSHGWSRFCVDS